MFSSVLNLFSDESRTVLMSSGCPDGWTGHNSRCFKYISTHLTWANAEVNTVI